jgi:prepilin-type N-terminal cleavage/methylation domain-containing protein
MTRCHQGFSLVELLVAMLVTSVVAAMLFQLFHQNERVTRDQMLIMEMQQTARIVGSQIADEIRMAGQGLPLYAVRFDPVPSEAVAVFLASSGSSRIDFQAALSNVETTTAINGPYDFSLGSTRSLTVQSSSGFSTGQFVYVSAYGLSSTPVWLRAELAGVSSTVWSVIPRNTGSTDTAVHFSASPAIALEEAESIYLSGGSVRRATAGNLADPANPVWGASNELGKNVTALSFTYYNSTGNVVQPTSLSNRMSIARVDIQLTVQTAGPLSNGTRPAYTFAAKTFPRNARVLHLN